MAPEARTLDEGQRRFRSMAEIRRTLFPDVGAGLRRSNGPPAAEDILSRYVLPLAESSRYKDT